MLRKRRDSDEGGGWQALQPEVFKFPPIMPLGSNTVVPPPPNECRIELLPRRRFNATFDDATLTLKLEPGKDGLNAVIDGWYNPILDHDKAVAEVEEKMATASQRRRDYVVRNRILKSWKVSWLLMNERPELLEEYRALRPRMEDFENWYPKIEDYREKIKAENEWKRYKDLEPKSLLLVAAEEKLKRNKEERDAAYEALVAAETDLEKCRIREGEAAARITVDHVMAEENKVVGGVAALFPNVQVGYIVTKINEMEVEDKPYEKVMQEFEEAYPPHTVEFRRYDYRRNPATDAWETLQQARARGQFVEDARFRRRQYVAACGRGDLADLEVRRERGEDTASTDQDGCTGLHRAAARGHLEVLELLLGWGADLEARDRNLRTPLMHAVLQRQPGAVEYLLRRRARPDTLDRLGRTPVMMAIKDGNFDMAMYLLERKPSLQIQDKHWGWTPLMFAAASGNLRLVQRLVEMKADVYALSKMKYTAQQIAHRASQLHVSDYLVDYVSKEPAQKMQEEEAEIWVGAKEAANPVWAHDRGFTAILSIFDKGEVPRKLMWLEEEEDLQYYKSVFSLPENQDDNLEAWHILLRHLRPMLQFVAQCVERGHKLLIHCDAGRSTSAAVYCAYLLTKKKVKVQESMARCRGIRQALDPTWSMTTGLQEMEDEMLRKKIDRLEKRLKKSAIVSLGF